MDATRLPDHMDRLFRAAYALCGTRHDAEDLVQETYARVLRRPRFVRRHGDLAYLLRALRNTWISLARAATAVPMAPDSLEFVAEPGGDPAAGELDARAAYTAIFELSPPLRDAIVAVDVVGLSYKEAARALEVRSGTVRSRLFRAREQVAGQLEAVSA
ncbi:MAG TPA: RNA polymerase sigma factor [Thermoleophilaceae bacterium]|jgi:RNA polymerase sigma-70 factor (ECF subfamily)